MQERRGARNEVDEQRGSECDARAREREARWNTRARKSHVPAGTFNFQMGRPIERAHHEHRIFEREKERVHNFRLKCEFP